MKKTSSSAVLPTFLAAFLLVAAGGTASPEPPSRLPNVVLFLLDDLGIQDLGVYGQPTTETPSIDRLAAGGMRFTELRASAAVCSPSRMALLTGKLPVRSGAQSAFHPQTRRGLDPADLTLADVFKARGYVTGHIGKWHLGTLAGQLPGDHGFDEYVLKAPGRIRFSDYRDPAVVVWNRGSERTVCYGSEGPQHPASCDRKPSRHLTDVFTDDATDFIDRHRERPFFLEVWHFAPHAPYEPEREYLARYVEPSEVDDAARFCDRYNRSPGLRSSLTPQQEDWIRACYGALVAQADAGVGRVLQQLEALGLAESTVVILTSDNGLARTSRMPNGGFRGSKLTLFEGGLRVPLIVSWPGRIAAGGVSQVPLFTHDLLPTLAEVVGVEPRSTDGRSFLAVLTGGGGVPDARPWVWQLEPGTGPENQSSPYDYAIRDLVDGTDYKLIATPASGGATRLFRIGDDPFERHDVAEENPDVVAAIERRYREWLEDKSAIPVEVARIGGGAGADASGRFDFRKGGTIALAEDFRHNVDDRDFTLALRLRPSHDPEAVTRRAQTVAEHRGSWKLSLLPGGRLRLVVHGVGKYNEAWASGDPACPSCIVLDGPGEIAAADAAHHLAFTVKGYTSGPSTVRLFVDGRLQAESRRLPKIAAGEGPMVFGGSGSDGLRGEISDLGIYGATLQELDLREKAARRGVVSAYRPGDHPSR